MSLIGELLLHQEFPGPPAYTQAISLAEVVAFAEQLTQAGRLPATAAERLLDVRLVVEELLTNVVRHAFREVPMPRGLARLELPENQSGHLLLRLHDNGPAFDPFDPANPPGYGLTLVRGLVGSYSWLHTGQENRLVALLTLI